MGSKKAKYSCKAQNCTNKYCYIDDKPDPDNKSFFRFPVKDLTRCLLWVNFSELNHTWDDTTDQYKNFYLCSDHFDLIYYNSTLKNSLYRNAIPTIKSATSNEVNVGTSNLNEPLQEIKTTLFEKEVEASTSNLPVSKKDKSYCRTRNCTNKYFHNDSIYRNAIPTIKSATSNEENKDTSNLNEPLQEIKTNLSEPEVKASTSNLPVSKKDKYYCRIRNYTNKYSYIDSIYRNAIPTIKSAMSNEVIVEKLQVDTSNLNEPPQEIKTTLSEPEVQTSTSNLPESKKAKYNCRAQNCTNKYCYINDKPDPDNKSFFRFPIKDLTRCLLWVNFSELNHTWDNSTDSTDQYKHFYLCSDHFDLIYYTSTLRNSLHRNAIPTIKSATSNEVKVVKLPSNLNEPQLKTNKEETKRNLKRKCIESTYSQASKEKMKIST